MTQSSCQENCNVDMQVCECNLDKFYFPSTCDKFGRHISVTADNRLNCNASNNIDPTIVSNDPVTINQSQHPAADLLNRNDSNAINGIFAGSTQDCSTSTQPSLFPVNCSKANWHNFPSFFLPMFVASFQKLMTLQL